MFINSRDARSLEMLVVLLMVIYFHHEKRRPSPFLQTDSNPGTCMATTQKILSAKDLNRYRVLAREL